MQLHCNSLLLLCKQRLHSPALTGPANVVQCHLRVGLVEALSTEIVTSSDISHDCMARNVVFGLHL